MHYRTTIVLSFVLVLVLALGSTVLGNESMFLIEGKRLYTDFCSNCHGKVSDSAKAGRSVSRIRSALRTFDQHRPFANISDETVLLISMALQENGE